MQVTVARPPICTHLESVVQKGLGFSVKSGVGLGTSSNNYERDARQLCIRTLFTQHHFLEDFG